MKPHYKLFRLLKVIPALFFIAAGDALIVVHDSYHPDTVSNSVDTIRWRATPDFPIGGEVARLPYNYQLPQLVDSVVTGPPPDNIVTTNYVDQQQIYLKWDGTDVVSMTTNEQALVDTKIMSDTNEALDLEAKFVAMERQLRAFALVTLDEVNILRERTRDAESMLVTQINSLRGKIRQYTSEDTNSYPDVTNPLATLSDRNETQLENAVRNKLSTF